MANNAIFKEFAADMAMQVAANEDVGFLTVDEVPAELQECLSLQTRCEHASHAAHVGALRKEKALEMAKEDLAGKPDGVKDKIVP